MPSRPTQAQLDEKQREKDRIASLSNQQLFEELHTEGYLTRGRSQGGRNMVRPEGFHFRQYAERFQPGEQVTLADRTYEFRGSSGLRTGGYFREVAPTPELPPMPEMPEMPEFELPEFNIEIPEPADQNPGALDVQGLKSKRGRLSDLRVSRELGPGQVSQLQAAANRAGLNLPV